MTSVTVATDGSALTLAGAAEGTATVTVTAEDSDGNRVSDAFEVEVSAPLLADVSGLQAGTTREVSLRACSATPATAP